MPRPWCGPTSEPTHWRGWGTDIKLVERFKYLPRELRFVVDPSKSPLVAIGEEDSEDDDDLEGEDLEDCEDEVE